MNPLNTINGRESAVGGTNKENRLDASTRTEANLPPLCRISHLLPILPMARSTLWLWVRQGRFPQPLKFGAITLWRREDVLDWVSRTGGDLPAIAPIRARLASDSDDTL